MGAGTDERDVMSNPPDDPFETALAALLAPLAQAMVAHGVTIRAANEAMKQAMVTAALATEDDTISDSRISMLTGIHRKDVKRLRAPEPENQEKRSCSAAALVISHWATAPDYQDASGCPRELSRKGDETKPGFDDLVRHTRIDMAPGTVLQTLLGQQIVSLTDEGRYRLLTHAFLPTAGSAEQVAAYQATLSAHLAAATHNLLADEQTPRHFDRAVRYSHLSAESVSQLHATAATQAQALLEAINAEARQLQDQDQDGDHKGRFVLGAYILPDPANGPTKKNEES